MPILSTLLAHTVQKVPLGRGVLPCVEHGLLLSGDATVATPCFGGQVRECTCRTLSNFTAKGPSVVQAAIDAGAIATVINVARVRARVRECVLACGACAWDVAHRHRPGPLRSRISPSSMAMCGAHRPTLPL